MHDQSFIAKVASWYYEEGLTQDEIAQRTRISRPTVSRLLLKAREEGIVQIRITHPEESVSDLEMELERRYSLREAVVIRTSIDDRSAVAHSLAKVAGAYLSRVVRTGDVLGIAWGQTLYFVSQELARHSVQNLRCVDLCGGTRAISQNTDSSEITRRIAANFGGDAFLLRAPLYLKSKEARDILCETEPIKTVVDMFDQVNIAVAGIGAIDVSVHYDSGLLSKDDLELLRSKGAVGDICSRFYNQQGEFLDIELHDRTLGISIDQLRNINHCIAVAGGERKWEAVLGALRTGVINALITDRRTAEYVLDH